ncbi:MAG: membrane protein [Candidatus Hydrogenedentota bacterium]
MKRQHGRLGRRGLSYLLCAIVVLVVLAGRAPGDSESAQSVSPEVADLMRSGALVLATERDESWHDFFPPKIIVAGICLLLCSAFFSGSETAFFSINRLRLRSIREDGSVTGALIAQTMEHPGRLLTTVLVGNMIINTLIGVLLGTRFEDLLHFLYPDLHEAFAYALAVGIVTSLLVFFGEIAPKVFAVQAGERIARLVVFPILLTDRVLAPIRVGMLGITHLLFQLTRFHEIKAAPFITDEEFKSALTDGEAQGVIEEDERQMIQGILEFSDALLREILVPRPDVIAVPDDATVRDALAVYKEHKYSRMPVYRENLDQVVGILVSKDLIPAVSRSELDRPVRDLMRPVHFVPATMTVQQFVRDAQRHRTHLAIVVDEYGGTAGIVTLEDAMEQVVGDIMDEGEHEEPAYRKAGDHVYLVDGSISLDELNELIGTDLHDAEHETVAGFLMHRSERILEPGDELEIENVHFIVESCEGKRVSSVRVNLKPPSEDGTDGVEGRPAAS